MTTTLDRGAPSQILRTCNVSLFGSFDGEFSERSRMYAGKGGVQVDWQRSTGSRAP